MPNIRKSSRKSVRKSIRKSKKYKECQQNVSKKIAINIDEFKEGRYASKSQAIAVAYAQVKKRHPECEKYLTK